MSKFNPARILPVPSAHLLSTSTLALLLAHCARVRTSEENLSITASGPPPMSGGNVQRQATDETITALSNQSVMPSRIDLDEEFNYEETFGALPSDTNRGDEWYDHHTEALFDARRTQRPLFVWLSNQEWSPNDRALASQVWTRDDFRRLVRGRVVRCKVDYSDFRKALTDYHTGIKEHYGARGYPFCALVLPDGTLIEEFKGYRSGYSGGYVSRLELAVQRAEAQIEEKRSYLIDEKNFRWWTDQNGNRSFACPIQYDEASDRIALRGMWEEQWIVDPAELSEPDQVYLAHWLTNEGKDYIRPAN